MKLFNKKSGIVIICIIFLAVALINIVIAIEPKGASDFTYIGNVSPSPSVGQMLNTSGGSISTVNFDTSTQNPRWKGFVGNVTGKFSLSDASNFSLYDWTVITIQGEIYATRNSTLVNWNSVRCAANSEVELEQTTLGFLQSDVDSINNTFNNSVHDEFYAGDKRISSNSCPSTNLYVNGSRSNKFEEVLLFHNNLIYTSLLENSTVGYNNQTYDYEIIIPDSANQSIQSQVYYFYIELI